MISFTVYGRPQQKGSKQAFVNRRKDGSTFAGLKDTNDKAKPWQGEIRAAAGEAYKGILLDGPLLLSAVFYFARPEGHYGTGRNAGTLKGSAPHFKTTAPDLDKLLRTLKDGLEGIIYKNDAQVSKYGELEKVFTESQERVEVTIEPLTQEN